jgi:hypothetical protein
MMKSAEKEKMCMSCEGRIPFNAEVCPYCASDQTTSSMHNSFKAPLFQSQSLEDSLTSLYTPPYQGKKPLFSQPLQEEVFSHEVDEDSHHLYREVKSRPEMNPLIGATAQEEEAVHESSLWPTFLLIGGTNFAILGLIQLFFSKNGVLALEWNANYWFLHCLISAPLLFYGYRKLRNLKG